MNVTLRGGGGGVTQIWGVTTRFCSTLGTKSVVTHKIVLVELEMDTFNFYLRFLLNQNVPNTPNLSEPPSRRFASLKFSKLFPLEKNDPNHAHTNELKNTHRFHRFHFTLKSSTGGTNSIIGIQEYFYRGDHISQNKQMREKRFLFVLYDKGGTRLTLYFKTHLHITKLKMNQNNLM